MTGCMLSVLVSGVQACALPIFVSVSLLLAVLGSAVAAETVAVLLSEPPSAGAVTVIVRSEERRVGEGRGRGQGTVPEGLESAHVQPVPEADKKVVPAVSRSHAT